MTTSNINASLKIPELKVLTPFHQEGDMEPDEWRIVVETHYTKGPLSLWCYVSKGVNSMAQESVIDEARWPDYVNRIRSPRGEPSVALADTLIAELWVAIDEMEREEVHPLSLPAKGTREFFRDELAKWIEANRILH